MNQFQNKANQNPISSYIQRTKILKFYNRYIRLQKCFEKSLIKCILVFGEKIFNRELDQLKEFSDIQKSDIEIECEFMRESLEIEGIKSFIDTQSLDSIVDKFISKKWEIGLNITFDIHKAYQVLDIVKIRELFETTDTEAAAIKNQEIILLLGPTGCGKSTTIHFLAGSVIKKVTVDGISHMDPIKNEEDPSIIEKVKTSPYPVSQTNCILTVELKKSLLRRNEKGYIYLCDTPGFGDTNGFEVDIVNSVGVVDAIKSCKSVRLLIIVSYEDAFSNRMRGLASLSHILSGFINDIKSSEDLFQFLFTHFPDEKKEELKAKVEYLLDEQERENNDQSFVFFLQELLNSISEDASIKFIDPISDDRIPVLKNICKKKALDNPSEHFKCSFDDQSKDKLKEQVARHQLVISSCANSQNYSLVKFKLNEIKFLKDRIDLPFIKKTFDDCLDTLKVSINKNYNNAIEDLEDCIQNSNFIQDKIIDAFQRQREYAKNFTDELKEEFSLEGIKKSETFSEVLINIDKRLNEQLKEKELDDDSLKIILQKLKKLSECFQEIKYKIDAIYEKLKHHQESFMSSVKSNNFSNCGNILKIITRAQVLLDGNLDSTILDQVKTEMVNSLNKNLNTLNDQIDDILKIDIININEKTIIKTNINILNSCKSDLVEFSQYYDTAIGKIIAYMEKKQKIIKETIQNRNGEETFIRSKYQNIAEIDILLQHMNLLIDVSDEIKEKSTYCYLCSLNFVYSFINELKRDIENDVEKIGYEFDNLKTYKKLNERLKCLEEIKWIDNYQSDNYKGCTYSSIKSSVQAILVNEVKKLKDEVRSLRFQLENIDNIKKANEIVNKMSEIGKLADFLPAIREEIKDTRNEACNRTKTHFEFIEKMTNDDKFGSLDLRSIENAFNYLNACRDATLIVEERNIIEVDFKLKNYVKLYRKFLEEEINSAFLSINCEVDETKFSNSVENLYEKLRKLTEITHYPLTSTYFEPLVHDKDSLITDCKKKLSVLYNSFEEDISKEKRTNNRNKVLSKLEKIKILRLLDGIINNESESFTELYKSTWKEFLDSSENIITNFENRLKENQYNRVHIIMNDLQKSAKAQDPVSEDHFNQCKDLLKRAVLNLIEQTRNLSTKFLYNQHDDPNNESILTNLVSNLNYIDQMQYELNEFVTLDTDKSLLERKSLILNRIEKGLIDQMEQLRQYVSTNNYPEAGKFVKSLKQKIDILDNHCSENLRAKVKEVEDSFKLSLQNLVENFKKKELKTYRVHSPIELFKNLSNDIAYNDTISELEEIIFDKFTKEIENIKDMCNEKDDNLYKNFDLEKSIKQLKRYASQNLLPLRVWEIINESIKELVEDIEKEKIAENKKIDEAVYSQNLRVIGDFYKKTRNQENKEKIEKFIDYKIEKTCSSIICLIDLKKITNSTNAEFSEGMNNLLEHIQVLVTNNIEMNSKELPNLINKLRAYIENIIGNLEKLFDFKYDTNNKTSSENCYYESFMFLQIYSSMKIETIEAIKLPIIKERLNKLVELIIDVTLKFQEKFKESISIWNLEVLKTILNKMQWCDNIINEVKTKYSSYSNRLSELQTDYLTMKTFVKEKIENLKEYFTNFELITECTKSSDYQRKLYYEDLKFKIQIVKGIKELDYYIDSPINLLLFENEINDILQKKCDTVVSILEEATSNFETGNITDAENANIYINYVHISLLAEHVCSIEDKVLLILKSVEQRIFRVIDAIAKNLPNSTTESAAEQLIKMKIVSDKMQIFKERIDKKIDETLYNFKLKSPTNEISKLGTILNGTPIGKIIITEHSIFEGFSFASFSKKVKPHGIDYVLKNLDGDNLNREKLRKRFNEFSKEYDNILNTYLAKDADYSKLKSEMNIHISKCKNQAKWNKTLTSLIPKTLAYIFVIWTLKKASAYFEAQELEDAEFYLRRPHPAQVIAIFRLLSVGDDEESLKNNLCEIGTGEGKSVVLAVVACVFAIFGYNVSCVCYSKYLSERDYNDYQNLFDTLDLTPYIQYGTFNEICETLINENGDVRDQIKKLITDSVLKKISQSTERSKILLIDEVDVFLKNEFYGNLYRPIVCLNNQIKPLIDYIWRNRNSDLNKETIKSISEYATVCSYYKGWEFLIDESINNLILDVNSFNKPEYVVKDDKIGYVEQDAVSFKTVYGYKTLFAYYAEHDKGKITSGSLDENVYLQVKCGTFSYSEMPHKFKFIMGATGTLRPLTEPEKYIVQNEYTINKKTFLPSVFGANQLTHIPENDVCVENFDDYYKKICAEVSLRLSGKVKGTQRAILIFFESKESLMKFYNFESFNSMRHLTKILTEEDNLTIKEKDLFVKDSTRSGSISLITRSFGRGTDFVCGDDNVLSNGGLHVIQTFLSEQYSEEVQIKGRTARQGDPGSYSMILLDKDLEKYSISIEDIKANKANIYDFINKKRNVYFEKHYNSDKGFKEFIKTEHDKSIKLQESLKSNNIEYIKSYLKETNKGPESTLYSKTLCLVDATGSMGDLLIQAKNKVHEMFTYAITVLNDRKLNPNCFQLQFAVYRDYDCGIREILEVSPWETKPDDLFTFMSKIKAHGGGDYEEAIEIGLQYANNEYKNNKITQIILIGDAPAKSTSKIRADRKTYGGEELWYSKFGPLTDYVKEAEKLLEKNVPVHTFYLKKDAKKNFDEIAKLTNGKSSYLDVSSENSQKGLAFLLTNQILANIGETCGMGDELSKKFMENFIKAHK